MTIHRRSDLDFLKALGLLCIILAHVTPPQFLQQLRSFDVPMMVILSGILAKISFQHAKTPICFSKYVVKRFTRLVIPTWIFLMVYFAFIFLFQSLPARTKIIRSFLLADMSIGYVWIVAVYMVCAVLAPFAQHIDLNKRSHVFGMISLYALHEVLCHFKIFLPYDMLNDLLFYIIPYGSMLILGMNYEKLKRSSRNQIICLSLLIYIAMALYLRHATGAYVYTNQWKYPARIYYLSYAVALSFLLLHCCTSHRNCRLFQCRFIRFLSRSSFWIYLWHILALKLVTAAFWPLRFILVALISCMITWLQQVFVRRLEKIGVHSSILSVFKG